AYHPLTIEGKKTAGLEIFAQNGFKVPDAIIIPVGDGVILSGVYKAFYDLLNAGLINKLPKLICVQAASSNAVHNFIKTGVYKDAVNPSTIADSISVKTPSNAYMTKKAIEESKGFSIEVTDNEIMNAQRTLAEATGIFAEPSSSAAAAALKKINDNNLLDADEQVVLLITGHGLKDIDAPAKYFFTKQPDNI
ncbi:MAG: pyridoxal-phosphate dependent enzyme, partial [Ignavibacteriae bacterium]|nr:pyridoxal-phosphate dependent enzyme [Ignavibacteriota bacterium]